MDAPYLSVVESGCKLTYPLQSLAAHHLVCWLIRRLETSLIRAGWSLDYLSQGRECSRMVVVGVSLAHFVASIHSIHQASVNAIQSLS